MNPSRLADREIFQAGAVQTAPANAELTPGA
jgi:hypothetical protein